MYAYMSVAILAQVAISVRTSCENLARGPGQFCIGPLHSRPRWRRPAEVASGHGCACTAIGSCTSMERMWNPECCDGGGCCGSGYAPALPPLPFGDALTGTAAE